ncbi:DUF1186 domain-containing protein [Inquilinus sp.]|uniref:DUF1186 domain-containing protein n=1 Tax=Inquilinus sp. TaxID=1932117 RepID=UPI0031E3084B
MTVDEVIRALAQAPAGVLPVDAMNWALDHWEEAGPRFIELVERYADGNDRSEDIETVLFFVIHLLGERMETRAFPVLCRLARNREAMDRILGEAITETFDRILIGTYDGDLAPLKAVIEDAAAGEFVREAAFEALAYHCRMGAISDEEMKAYLLHLAEHMQPRDDNAVWIGWTTAVSSLGYEDLAPTAERLINDFLEPVAMMDVDDFRDDLRRTLDDPDRMAGFIAGRLMPFMDTVGTLSTWYSFSEEYRVRHARGELDEEFDDLDEELDDLDDPLVPRGWPSIAYGEPAINPARDVGRNDPCPCGSGKKYKKCCLGK